MVAASAAGIVVSLFTPAVAEERLTRFYRLSRTPIQPGESISEPCTLPASAPRAERRMLITACGLEIPAPSATSVVGFIVTWLCVWVFIVGFNWLAS
jgi:hypothetical protein